MADVPLLVVSENASLERRITPSWSIWQLKAKLESVTGIPPSSQSIFLKPSGQDKIAVAAADEDATLLESFPLAPYLELHVRYDSYDSTLHDLPHLMFLGDMASHFAYTSYLFFYAMTGNHVPNRESSSLITRLLPMSDPRLEAPKWSAPRTINADFMFIGHRHPSAGSPAQLHGYQRCREVRAAGGGVR